jgi:transcriptional regulator with GAF, ATPase, and Fis domain
VKIREQTGPPLVFLTAFAVSISEESDLKQDFFHGLFGASSAMRSIFDEISRLARVDSTVLIEGETGTGKERVARAICQASARAGKPLVTVNCAALTESLAASELFGHKRGAFTGAGQVMYVR